MLFSSLVFLYVFLPVVLGVYYLLPSRLKNLWLLLSSLIFFAWGGVSNTLILIGSIVLNYVLGRLIASSADLKRRRRFAVAGISSNILLLVIFKYANFISSNLNDLFQATQLGALEISHIALPVGISFYTFHCLSYLVDVYTGKTKEERNLLDLALYVSMFSQLVAGPIIRYRDVGKQIHQRLHTRRRFVTGLERFSIGLAEKVLLANNLAVVSDRIFALDDQHLGTHNAWLGMLCYSFQIYYDFSGYSDMAIGLGKLFGFEFKENFNFPYLATSVRDFWRRWHISLSTFFRDYLYIPLGGNQKGVGRTYLNLLIVFFLTGLWHGANWTFVCWGLIHGVLMIVERLGFEKHILKRFPGLARIYTLFFVMLAWILFKIPDIESAAQYWRALFVGINDDSQNELFYSFFDREFMTVVLIAVFGAFGGFRFMSSGFRLLPALYREPLSAMGSFMFIVLLLSTLYLMAGSYNPFIYYQF